MYYLQSRYYDPETGRFLNADDIDYLGADGTPISYNLFAYCKNNPVAYIDSTGASPLGILDIRDYYIIHRMVQKDCVKEMGWVMEVAVRGEKRGRLDLYDAKTNTYYEVKSKHAAYNRNGVLREVTANQMQRYDNSYIVSRKVPGCRNKTPTRGNTFVSGHLEYGIWDIDYSWEQSGLITYDVSLF